MCSHRYLYRGLGDGTHITLGTLTKPSLEKNCVHDGDAPVISDKVLWKTRISVSVTSRDELEYCKYFSKSLSMASCVRIDDTDVVRESKEGPAIQNSVAPDTW